MTQTTETRAPEAAPRPEAVGPPAPGATSTFAKPPAGRRASSRPPRVEGSGCGIRPSRR